MPSYDPIIEVTASDDTDTVTIKNPRTRGKTVDWKSTAEVLARQQFCVESNRKNTLTALRASQDELATAQGILLCITDSWFFFLLPKPLRETIHNFIYKNGV